MSPHHLTQLHSKGPSILTPKRTPTYREKNTVLLFAWVALFLMLQASCSESDSSTNKTSQGGGGSNSGGSAGQGGGLGGSGGLAEKCHSSALCDAIGDWELTYVVGATMGCSLEPTETLSITANQDGSLNPGFGKGGNWATLTQEGCYLEAHAESHWEEGGEPQSDIRKLDVKIDGDIMRGTLYFEAWWSCNSGGYFDVLGVRKGANVDSDCKALPPGPGCILVDSLACDWAIDDFRLAYNFDEPLAPGCMAPTADFWRIFTTDTTLCVVVDSHPADGVVLAAGECAIDVFDNTQTNNEPSSHDRIVHLDRSAVGLTGTVHYTSDSCSADGSAGPISAEGPYSYLNWSATLKDDPSSPGEAPNDTLFDITFSEIAPNRRMVDLQIFAADSSNVMREVSCELIDGNQNGFIDVAESVSCTELMGEFGAWPAGTSMTVVVYERAGDYFPQRVSLEWTP